MHRGRFAPTPSGLLHVGSARTALASALAAWRLDGRWVLRVEDLDALRTPTGATEAMLDDLRWLGLTWDEGPVVGGPNGPYAQSARRERYRAALEQLIAAGRAYPCLCSRRDVEQSAQAPHGAEPVYPGTCRGRDPGEVTAEAKLRGRGVSWRFRVDPSRGAVDFDDLVAGSQSQDVAREVGDFVIQRADGVAAYQLAVVVDDIAMEITEVVRGDDLLPSTGRQVLLYEALGATAPRWAHVPLVLGDDGERMAKRHGSLALRVLRARGDDPARLRATLIESLGLPEGARDLHAIAQDFTWDSLPRTPTAWRIT